MGQKTHPNGFRLVTTQKHLSNWYTDKFNYSSLIEEDYLIRTKIEEVFQDLLTLSKIQINRIIKGKNSQEYINIQISALFPREKEMSRKVKKYFSSLSIKEIENKEALNIKTIDSLINSKGNLKEFTSFLLKKTVRNLIRFLQLKTKKNYSVHFQFIKNPFEDSILISKFISEQLEKRTPFRRIVKQTIKKVQRTNIKGIKIELSGRLNGIEIARSEWKRNGKIPLHTLKAKIDYTNYSAHTIYGIIGIKIWLFHGYED